MAAVATCNGCRTVDPNFEIPWQYGEAVDVSFRVANIDGAVEVEFRNRTIAPFIVQEVHMEDGQTLVECFHTSGPFDIVHDFHSWGGVHGKRWMEVYVAEVEGVDLTFYGFGQLAENIDGSTVTEIDTYFNMTYQWKGLLNTGKGHLNSRTGLWYHPDNGVAHETRGRVTKRAASSFYWSIVSDADGILVTGPEGSNYWERQ